jgi:hypothetical protein
MRQHFCVQLGACDYKKELIENALYTCEGVYKRLSQEESCHGHSFIISPHFFLSYYMKCKKKTFYRTKNLLLVNNC